MNQQFPINKAIFVPVMEVTVYVTAYVRTVVGRLAGCILSRQNWARLGPLLDLVSVSRTPNFSAIMR